MHGHGSAVTFDGRRSTGLRGRSRAAHAPPASLSVRERVSPFDTYCVADGALPSVSPLPSASKPDFARIDMREIVAAEIGDRELAEDVVEDRGRVLDRVVALHQARRLEAREGEGLDIFLERHAVLQAERDGDGEVVHQASGRPRLPCACR